MAKKITNQTRKRKTASVKTKKTSKNNSKGLLGNLLNFSNKKTKYIIGVVILAIIGTVLFKFSNAATTVSSNCSPEGQGENGYLYPFCREDAGAKLPISYDLATLPSSAKYVSVDGSDSNNGSANTPFKTLAKAISSSNSGGTIVVKNGTYREGGISIYSNKTIKIVAYPGHSPVFSGSKPVDGGWQAEGGASYISYNPRPVTEGSGIDFNSGGNLTGDKVGKYPDQAWIGNTQLKQVTNKSELKDGTFWVDQINKRLYLTTNDSKKSNIEVSGDKGRFIRIDSPNSSIEGITVTRYSNGGADYGVVLFQSLANNSGLKDVKIIDSAYLALMFAGNSSSENPILKNNYVKNLTIEDSGWMGIVSHYTDNLTVEGSKIRNMNLFSEFAQSPQSGAIKAARSRYTKINNNDFSDNKSYAIWFDMSNKDAEIANNILIDNTASALFYEISDGLILANNYIKTSVSGSQAVKTAGSSGLNIINNTIIGGKDPVGIYTDDRSRPDCANPAKQYCSGSWTRVRDEIRPYDPLIDFYPRIDLMINNIIAYPSGNGYCSRVTAVCITSNNATAVAPLETIIHKANSARGIPETKIDGNVYVNEGGALVTTSNGAYSNLNDFTVAMSKSPILINGLDQNGQQGKSFVNKDGTPTSALKNNYSKATPIPNNTKLNKYISAGTKHIGVIPATATSTTPPPTPTPTPDPTPQPPTNLPPTVSLSGIKSSYTDPANIAMTISSSDPDGSVAKVEIYNGNTKLGEIPGTKNSFTWNNAPVGSHSITAKATDDKGDSTTSNAINTKVEAKPTTPPPPPPPTADTQPPSIPSALSRSLRADWGRGKYVMDLKWSPSIDNSGTVASYQITRNGAVLGTTANTSFTDGLSLKAGTLYTYTVTAKDPSNNTSSPASITAKARCFWFICTLE